MIPYDKETFDDIPINDFRFFVKESLNTQSELEQIMRCNIFSQSFKLHYSNQVLFNEDYN
jgi:hypothetical protein